MKIYLTRYGFDDARIMSIEAVDEGIRWECERGTVKMEMGSEMFFIPDMVPKRDAGVFTSLADAAASLVSQIESDITKRQAGLQKLYTHIGALKRLS